MNTLLVLSALVAAAAASGYNTGLYAGPQGYGLGHHGVGNYGLGVGHHGFGGYGYNRGGPVKYFNDHSGNTVPTMGKDQNNDGLADKLDSNRDGKVDGPRYGYGRGYGYGTAGYGNLGYGAGGYGVAGHGNLGYGVAGHGIAGHGNLGYAPGGYGYGGYGRAGSYGIYPAARVH